jgi:hypothetical protein
MVSISISCSKEDDIDPAPDPVAYYPFNGNTNDIAGSFNGLLHGGAVFTSDRNGNPSAALKLDGLDDFVELGDLDLGSSFTIGFWINPTTINDRQAFVALNTTNSGNHQENGLLFGYWNGGLHVRILTSTHTESQKTSGWQHLVLTVKQTDNSSAVAVYRDGMMMWSQTYNTVVPITNLKPWLIGMEYDGSAETDFLNGEIDDVKFFDVVLTQQEISGLYLAD